jgi:hypothetical protein
MARIRTPTANPFSKYTLKKLQEMVKNYNIQNYSKMKKSEIIEYLNERFIVNDKDVLVLKTGGFPSQFQMNQPDNLAFNPDVFSNENEQMSSNEPPVYSQRPTGKGVMMPATKGNRKTYPVVANRKKPIQTPGETKTMRVRKTKN